MAHIDQNQILKCIDTAERAGYESEKAGECYKGDLNCSGCPFFPPKEPKPSRLVLFMAAVLAPFNIMVRECSWCKKLLGFKRGEKGITSGICKKCADSNRDRALK